MASHVRIKLAIIIMNKEEAMYVVRLLQKHFEKSLSNVHAKMLKKPCYFYHYPRFF
jgi:hypothetical protein